MKVKFLLALVMYIMGTLSYADMSAQMICKQKNWYATQREYILNINLVKEPQIFFLFNKSNQTLILDHPSHRSAQAGWSSYLSPNHYSAIAVTKADFNLRCASIHENGQSKVLNCKDVLRVCQPELKSLDVRSGNFWLAENLPLSVFIKALLKRGIALQAISSEQDGQKSQKVE